MDAFPGSFHGEQTWEGAKFAAAPDAQLPLGLVYAYVVFVSAPKRLCKLLRRLMLRLGNHTGCRVFRPNQMEAFLAESAGTTV